MIDSQTIRHIAQLARLRISEAEAQEYGEQLTKVLTHFQQIEKINTKGVEPLVTPAEIGFFMREDVAQKQSDTAELMANAPDKAGHLFKVPPVV
jgi:aspartyl-tRNA(Asn)/glutamyl-tRNA(Gln) amidotransferase subunit C